MQITRSGSAGLWACAILAAVTPALGTAALPPIEAFGRIPQATDFELSPNGSLIAWEDNRAATQRVVIFDLEHRKVVRTLEIDAGMKLREIIWADDETVLFDVSLTYKIPYGAKVSYEIFRTLAADVSGGSTRMLLMSSGDREYVTGSTLLATRTPKPKTVTMWTWDFSDVEHREEVGTRLAGKRKDSGWVASVFEVDTRSGKGRLIAQGTQFTDDWVVDADGQPVVRSEWQPENHVYRVLAKRADGWQEIHRQTDGESPRIPGLTADGESVIVLGSLGHGLNKLWTIPLEGGVPQVLVEDAQFEVTTVIADWYTQTPVGARLGGSAGEIRWFNSQAAAYHKSLSQAFPGRRADVVGRSANARRLIARIDSPSLPATYYIVDFGTGKADIVGEEYPQLAGVPLGEVLTMSYPARDGTAIPAYVTIPPGKAAENLPLVVLPHGGPESRDRLSFDWLAQFLASRGYAVLQPQFRGSTGYGEAHRKAGYRQWGGLMQDDINDGVKALIARGMIDPRRVCIAGASYGGYAALAGAAFAPELYSCAISINGVSDLPDMIGYVERQSGDESDSMAYWRDHIGSPFDARVIDKSPARAANNIRAPILLLHGVDDTVVPVSQSETMARALKQFDKPYALLKLSGEDHWLSRSETRIRVLKELETFLAEHL